MLANRERIGCAFWELLWLINADSEQVPIRALKDELGKTDRRVSQNLKHLESEQLVAVTRVAGKPSLYRMNW